jgi:hypothetical protein
MVCTFGKNADSPFPQTVIKLYIKTGNMKLNALTTSGCKISFDERWKKKRP